MSPSYPGQDLVDLISPTTKDIDDSFRLNKALAPFNFQ
jgi:hypothetical protein